MRLLSRVGRTTQPTEAGFAICDTIRQILRDARGLKHLASTDTPAGQLRIGVIGTAVTGVKQIASHQVENRFPSWTLVAFGVGKITVGF